ncbi:MAG: hypothetical protein P4L98_06655 [Ancalomicrobiaceae bacterium]|nr:hypothetical protein [Ancalomicrobiaceae bacterium]
MAEEALPISVTVLDHIDPKELRLIVDAKNNSDRPIFLFNILHKQFGEDGFYGLDNVYSEISSGILHISQKLFPIPALRSVERPNVPFVTVVEAGTNYSWEIRVDLPIHLHNPYGVQPAESSRSPAMYRAVFQLGYFLGVEATRKLLKEFPVRSGHSIGFDVFPEGSQRMISVDLKDALPVIV